jgi:parvin
MIDWINDELADFRILVKDLEEDLFDGQILQKLIGNWYLTAGQMH